MHRLARTRPFSWFSLIPAVRRESDLRRAEVLKEIAVGAIWDQAFERGCQHALLTLPAARSFMNLGAEQALSGLKPPVPVP